LKALTANSRDQAGNFALPGRECIAPGREFAGNFPDHGKKLRNTVGVRLIWEVDHWYQYLIATIE
jgi:hypothetical protein